MERSIRNLFCRPGVGPVAGLCAAALIVVGAALLVVAPSAAEASTQGQRVEFTVTANTDDDISSRAREKVAERVVEQIKQRLDAMELKHYQVEPIGGSNVEVIVYGDHSPEVIKGGIVPQGELQFRPVLVDSAPWLEVAPQLPEGVEFYHEPGSMRPDSFFLFSTSPAVLREAVELVPDGEGSIELFPHEDGWRTLNLGEVVATEDDISSAQVQRNRAGASFVNAELSADAVQRVRSKSSEYAASQLAVVLDGEVVAVMYFSEDSFGERLTVDPPGHLGSPDARAQWAMQVGGRMAASMPVQLGILEE